MEFQKETAHFHRKGEQLCFPKAMYGEALVCYNRAIKLDPKDVHAYLMKSAILSTIGKSKEAVRFVNQAINIDPNYANNYSSKGDFLRQMGRNEEALDCYDKAISLTPNDSFHYSSKGDVLAEMGKNEEALGCYEKGFSLYSRGTSYYGRKSNVLRKMGKDKEAVDFLNPFPDHFRKMEVSHVPKNFQSNIFGSRKKRSFFSSSTSDLTQIETKISTYFSVDLLNSEKKSPEFSRSTEKKKFS